MRELKNFVQRMFILADTTLEADLTPPRISKATHNDAGLLTVRVGTTLDEANRRLIEATLADCGHVRRKAAEMLGISVKTLYNKLEHYKTPQHVRAAGQTSARCAHPTQATQR